MPFMPFHILGDWFRGAPALLILGAGLFLLREWYTHRQVYVIEQEFSGSCTCAPAGAAS